MSHEGLADDPCELAPAAAWWADEGAFEDNSCWWAACCFAAAEASVSPVERTASALSWGRNEKA